MKLSWNAVGKSRVLLRACWAGFLVLAGCQGEPPKFTEVPQVSEDVRTVVDPLRVGDPVVITFSSTSPLDPVLQAFKETIKEDGTITPPVVGSVVAAGKTLGDLQKELQEKYVVKPRI